MKTLSFILVLLGYNYEVPTSLIQSEVKAFYGQSVTVVTDRLPASSYYKPRNRYRADSILNYFKRTYPDNWVIGLTSRDISTTHRGSPDYGIFGLGSLSKHVCITSVYRLKSRNCKERVIKVILHEIGHTKGLLHCVSGLPCLMQEGNATAAQLDKTPKQMCTACKRKINL